MVDRVQKRNIGRRARIVLATTLLCNGCDIVAGDLDQVFSKGADQGVVCGINLDDKNSISADSIGAALDRAQLENSVVHLYSHQVGATVDESTIELAIAGAADRGMSFVTYRDMIEDPTITSGLALSFDDDLVPSWVALLPLLQRYQARVTFFISRYRDELNDGLHILQAAGNDIQFHSTNHQHASQVAASLGVNGYIAQDILPGLAAMRQAGFSPTAFAYPYGERTTELDTGLLTQFRLLRGSHFSCPR
jgi:hypothetical protein